MFRILLLGCLIGACAQPRPDTEAEVRRIAGDVIPRVEAAVGLTFTAEPEIAVRSRAQVAGYLVARMAADFPEDKLGHIATAYRLFGLIGDTTDLRALVLNLLSEQVAGFYDPDSTTLYVVEGTDPVFLRTVLAHELVHALQAQYMPLDSLLDPRGNNDRQMAIQAVLEGQATLASLSAMVDEATLAQLDNFWRDVRESLRQQQESSMPAFASAPLIFREGLVFPYLAGADFMRWFTSAFPGAQPFGARMPRSTEQILHPERYRDGDEPVSLRFAEHGAAVPLYQDSWGEFETRIVLQELTGSESLGTAGALGWDGDQYGVFVVGDDHALVWWSVWDGDRAAEKFATMLRRYWAPERPGSTRRWTVDRRTLGERTAVLLVDAPGAWLGWNDVPEVTIR
ncbi:MAG TPA: hypothetical protein VGA37_11130 [Gemmatimonadales bacterium]